MHSGRLDVYGASKVRLDPKALQKSDPAVHPALLVVQFQAAPGFWLHCKHVRLPQSWGRNEGHGLAGCANLDNGFRDV